ncbi:MAG: TonB-dependent receptor [Candidatus Zixiibacteriota bacterium]
MWRVLFCLCVIIAVGAMGAAASDDEGSFESPWELPDTIVVTANRFRLPPKESVWPVSVVSLNEVGAQSSLDVALEGKTGMDVRNVSGYGSVSTLSNWGVFNRHMLLLYNGRVVKDYSLGGFNLSDFSAQEFERVEIVKGPQSAFYGSDAVGGVVNLISRSSLVDRVELTAQYGSLNYRQYHLDLARKVGLFGLGAFAEVAETDNRRDNAGGEHTIFGVRSDYLSRNNRHQGSISARYFEDSLGVPGPLPDPLSIPVYGNKESSSLTAHQKDQNYSLDVQYRFFDEELGELQVDAFWEKKNLHYKSLYNYQVFYTTIDSSMNPPDSVLNVDSVDVHSLSVYNKRSSGISTRFMKEMKSLSAAGGIDWLSGSLRATSADSSMGTNIVGPFTPFTYEFTTFNFWSARQNQFDIWGDLALWSSDSARFDVSGRLQFVKNRKMQVSYNVGLITAPTPAMRLKLGYAYAFRLPTIAEQFADDVYTAGNANLRPETARTIQLTTTVTSSGNSIHAELTLFRQRVNSLIQYYYDPAIYRSVPRNVEKFQSHGLDATIRFQASRNFSIGWSGVVQNAEQSVDTGQMLVDAYYVPDIKWRTDIHGSFDKLTVNINFTYTSERTITLYDGNRKDIQSVYELGMNIGLRVNEHLSLSLTSHDLTDQRRPDQFGFTLRDGDYPTLGRRFIFEARVSVL